MGQFRIFLMGWAEPQLVELPACGIPEVGALAANGRFLAGELVDVADEDGVLTNRRALLSVSRIQMIVEE
ncbi:MAG: hypothetical protein P0Y64_09050 [Candidatus Sphingomonas colombiensis]|nr:hypothetical protein [Sphingomonas sp.]WEK44902.1 MAG: hypothetical protein P0Y64_09050 [Sphingomonas sp.]